MKEVSNDLEKARNIYGKLYYEHKNVIVQLKSILLDKNLPVVLWGAGLKGLAFIDLFDPVAEWIDYIIDQDTKKQGNQLFSGHVIKGAEQLDKNSIILIANKNYYSSVCFDLIRYGFDIKYMKLICLDQVMDGSLLLSDIQNGTAWIRRKYYD